MDAPGAANGERHDLQVTRGYAGSLPAFVRAHLLARVVDRLADIEQEHSIAGLM